MDGKEWLDYIAHKEWQVKQAENGETLQAKAVLDDAVIALRDVLLGELPGADRLPSLRFLLSAIEQIQDAVKPETALGLWCNNRPKKPTLYERDFLWFVALGTALNKHHYTPHDNDASIENIRAKVAHELGVSKNSIRTAWERFGGLEGWRGWEKGVQEKG